MKTLQQNHIYLYSNKLDTTQENINKYKNKFNNLKHIKIGKNFKGLMLIYKNEFIGIIQCNIITHYIVGLYINIKYRHKNIATCLIDYVENILNIKYLSVNKNNTNAINLYKKLNYILFKQDEHMLYMYKNYNICININKWNKNKILLITGLSGSGKTYLSNYLSNKHKAIHINLDDFEFHEKLFNKYLLTSGEHLIKNYFIKNNIKFNKTINDDNFFKLFEQFINYLYNYINSHNKLFIIEGIQIYGNHFNKNIINNSSIILINKPIIKVINDRLKRNNETNNLNILDDNLLNWYNRQYKSFNKFKNKVVKI